VTYAKGTSVPVERSKAELDRLLSRAGATQRLIGSDDEHGVAFAAFSLTGRQVRLRVPLPRRGEPRFVNRPGSSWRQRPKADAERAWDQAVRERWRGLVLLVKAKLEAIGLGVSTPEREFMADIALPDGRTVHQALAEQLELAYLNGKMPPLLGPGLVEDES